MLGVRIEGKAILQGFVSTSAESADETAQPPHLFRLRNLAQYYLLSSPVIQSPTPTKEICERTANIVERDTGRNTL